MNPELKRIVEEARPELEKRKSDCIVRGGVVNGRSSIRCGNGRGKGWEAPHGSFSFASNHPGRRVDTSDPNWI